MTKKELKEQVELLQIKCRHLEEERDLWDMLFHATIEQDPVLKQQKLDEIGLRLAPYQSLSES